MRSPTASGRSILARSQLGRLIEEQMRIEDEWGRLRRHKKKCNPCPPTFLLPISPTAQAMGSMHPLRNLVLLCQRHG